MKASKVLVTCPKCGHSQHEPSTAYSSVCKECREYFRLEDVRRPKGAKGAQRADAVAEPAREVRHVACFQCGTDLEVSLSAQSTMCKRCSAHVDLKDHQITGSVSKNFRTRGRLVVEEGGFLFNTETQADDVVLKGRFLGKLIAEHVLEIHRSAEIKGTFKAGCLVIPAGNAFRWAETLELAAADISGELDANVRAGGTMILRSTARFFGNLEARNLVVEEGAVIVGRLKLGTGIGQLV